MSHHRCCCGGGSCQCLGRCQFSEEFVGPLVISESITLGGTKTGRSCPGTSGCRPQCVLSPFGLTSISRTVNNASIGCGAQCYNQSASVPVSFIQCQSTDQASGSLTGELIWCFGEGTPGQQLAVDLGVVLGLAGGFATFLSVTIGSPAVDYPINRFELDQPTWLSNSSKQCSAGSQAGEGRLRNVVWGARSLANNTWAAGFTINLGAAGLIPLGDITDWNGSGSASWFGSCTSEIFSGSFTAFIHSTSGGCAYSVDASASGFAEYSYGGLTACSLLGQQERRTPEHRGVLERRVQNNLWRPGEPLPLGALPALRRARASSAGEAIAAGDLL